MYRKHFGLTRHPFEINPDPYFFFPTSRHNEALASLYYGIKRSKGFVVLTGEVGTGKTLLIRCLLDLLNRDQIAFAYVFNSKLPALQFLQYVANDLGIRPVPKGKADLLIQLNNFLIARCRKNLSTVLIVDEAQHLRRELLEEIRLLTNLETSQQKLLQIMLVGQPELDEKLEANDLRQLKQRIAMRCRLDPLPRQEVRDYVLRRLLLAGCASRSLFPPETLDAVYRYSRGIPRLVNTICENALISAYAMRFNFITPSIIEEVAKDFRLEATSVAEIEQVISGTQLHTEAQAPAENAMSVLAKVEAVEEKAPTELCETN